MIRTTLRVMKVVTAGDGGSDGDDDENGDGYNVHDKGCAVPSIIEFVVDVTMMIQVCCR